jgi:hypothetical protein
MRLFLSIVFFVAISVKTESDEYEGDEDFDYEFEIFDEVDSSDADWMAENCALICKSDSSCIQGEQKICDGHHDCLDGSDEADCKVDDSVTDDVRRRLNRPQQPQVNTAQSLSDIRFDLINRLRGKLGFGGAPQTSQFAGFSEEAFQRYQNRNSKLWAHVVGPTPNGRLQQLNKIMYFMSNGKQVLANYLDYGCHCNIDQSGGGQTKDVIDSVCTANSGCRKCATLDYNCDPNTAYAVAGQQAGKPESTRCMDPSGTCGRALCECDLQFVRDLISNRRAWNKSRHVSLSGYDRSECKSVSIESLSGASPLSGSRSLSGTSSEACCGTYPTRFPYSNDGTRECCGGKTFHNGHMECCQNQIVSLGGC